MKKRTTMNRKIMGLLLVVGTSIALAGCTSGNASAKTEPAEAATSETQTTTPAQPDTQPAQPDTQPAQPDAQPAQPDTQTAQPDTQPAQSSQQTSQPAAASGTAVNDQQALSLAINAAGVAQADVSSSQVKLDFDDDYGKQIYEVEFHVGSTEYSYDIDPETGSILSSDIDVDD